MCGVCVCVCACACVCVSSVNIDATPSFHLLLSCFVRVIFLCPFRGLNRAVVGANECLSSSVVVACIPGGGKNYEFLNPFYFCSKVGCR